MNTRQLFVQGSIAGVIGFATVVVMLAIVNVLAGRPPLHTAALLGNALFGGGEDPSQVALSAGPILGYSLVHLAVFVVFGIVAAALAGLADRGWQLWFVALFFFIFISFHLYAAVQALAAPGAGGELSGIVVWGAGFAASLLMALYLVRAHPRLRSAQVW
jgi:hypothetical protein